MAISGWAKGAEYRPGDAITAGPANHSWNAVYVDGSWHLVDCHWASRYLRSSDGESSSSTGDSDGNKNYGFDYDDFYFMTVPDEMIYSHLPVDEKWQLLESPWSSGLQQRLPSYSSILAVGIKFKGGRGETPSLRLLLAFHVLKIPSYCVKFQ